MRCFNSRLLLGSISVVLLVVLTFSSGVSATQSIAKTSRSGTSVATRPQDTTSVIIYDVKVGLVRVGSFALGSLYAIFVTAFNGVKRLWLGPDYFKVQERPNRPEILSDPQYGQHGFLQLQDVRLHYVETGDRSKPLMLFVHGFPEFWFSWRHQMKEFASTHWVVAIDCRGYGESDKPKEQRDYKMELLEQDIAGIVHALGRQSCILVAHDWGAAIAWNVAAHNPTLIEKLVIMNGPHPVAYQHEIRTSFTQFMKSYYIFLFQVPVIPEWTSRTNDLALFDSIFVDKNNHPTDTPEEMEAYKYTFSQQGAFTPPINYYRANLPVFLISDPSNPFPNITVPTLLIWGQKDVALSPTLPEATRPFVTDLTIKYIPDGTHFIQQDKPEEVNSLIREFVN